MCCKGGGKIKGLTYKFVEVEQQTVQEQSVPEIFSSARIESQNESPPMLLAPPHLPLSVMSANVMSGNMFSS